jgi:hypothetical protein
LADTVVENIRTAVSNAIKPARTWITFFIFMPLVSG